MFFSDYGIQIRLDAILMIQTEHSIHHSPCTCSFLASEWRDTETQNSQFNNKIKFDSYCNLYSK